MKTQIAFIPDVIEDVANKVCIEVVKRIAKNLQYAHGELEDVVTDLIQKEGNPNKPAKYPLLWFVLPYLAIVNRDSKTATLREVQFIIAHVVNDDTMITDSDQQIVKPILFPIMEELINQFSLSERFTFSGNNYAVKDFTYSSHRKAKDTKSNKPILYDYVDYLDVRIKDMNIKNIC